MKKRKKRKTEESGDPVWLTTFADAMSLMLTFFVMIFAATSLNKGKVEQALGSLRGALGVMEKTKPAIVSPTQIVRESEAIAGKIRYAVTSRGLSREVRVEVVKGGVRVSLSSPILFDLGKANLKRDIFPLLDEIAALLREIPNEIVIEGHTDNLPIHTERFPSNWELSSARAISVARYFIDKGIAPLRIGVVGYADSRPLFPNDTPEHRAKNRRVEIFIKEKGAF
ncbi:MAG TPA: flagellar motor protein MotB [Candidatus Aerophobetes bacterium]|uniref:Flagellar motor protein MotB n=1 Tax=Aerophobetes bacterium TaxID=2030807 RepID=A0A7V5HYE5_UNCAE|nr:flagellar motor protein MotB [Candidatus Aerophobetes bacterium]